MDCLIAGKNFTYVQDYRDDASLRDSFNALTRQVYGFDFAQWFAGGYWSKNYIPCSFVYNGAVVANASVNLIDFEVWGERRHYIQVGTVMTDSCFRQLGLSRLLMERIMEKWGATGDLLYLFANDSVRGFYPKFGFSIAEEYQCSKTITRASGNAAAQKVDMEDGQNRRRLMQKINSAKAIAPVSMRGYSGLVMFYCTLFMRDNVYYLPQHDAFAVAGASNSTLHLYDLFCERDIPMDEVIGALATAAEAQVELGFTPRCKNGFSENLLQEEDTTLFMMGTDARLWQDNRFMFPILSRA